MERNFNDDEIAIDLREIFFAIRRKFLVIVATGLFFGCLACVFTKFFMTPIYTSTSSMLVLPKETTQASPADLQMGSQLTNDYRVLITSRPVVEEVIENLNLDTDYKTLAESVTVDNPSDTRILNVAVENTDAELAAEIVNELSSVASGFIGDKMEVTPPKIIQEGEIPTVKTGPSMIKNTLLGILIGFLISGGIVVLMTIMDDTIKCEEDIEKYLGIPMLASLPDRKDYIATGKKNKKKKRKRK